MYGVYNPGKAHVLKNTPAVPLTGQGGVACPKDYVRVHWQSTLRQSYQDFFVTQDDNPSVKARFRWYKPYGDDPYITVFSDPNYYVYDTYFWDMSERDCLSDYADDLNKDILVYLN